MSALINRLFALISPCAARKIAARAVPVCGCRDAPPWPRVGPSDNARKCAEIARVPLRGQRVHFPVGRARLRAETAKLDAAIAANLKELGYGG